MYNKIQLFVSNGILIGVWSNLFYQIKVHNYNKTTNKKTI